MNRSELVGDIAAELTRVLPDDDKDLDGDDLDTAETTVAQVLKDAEEAIDSEDEDDAPAGMQG